MKQDRSWRVSPTRSKRLKTALPPLTPEEFASLIELAVTSPEPGISAICLTKLITLR
jgi:hypothetical protein